MMPQHHGIPRRVQSCCAALVLVAALWTAAPLLSAHAGPASGLPSGASCAQLAAIDQTATNGSQWGRALLPGHGAPGGWFGVDVCANGIDGVSPGGANLSCDRVPANLAATGCAPGHATYDGFGLSFQCVELIARFAAWAFGDRPYDWIGNAPDLWSRGNHPADFVAYANGGGVAPVPGDILVWGAMDGHGTPWPAGPSGRHDGHVAVVAAASGGQLVIAEQNVLWGETNRGSEVLALTHVGGQWIVGDNRAATAALPTYHWHASMGTTRALYGWLHSSKNGGQLTGAGSVPGTPVPSPTQQPPSAPHSTPQPDTSGGFPSLARGVVVTAAGTLADLTWSARDAASGDAAGPRAVARSLGAPPGVRLAVRQTPAVVTLPSGARNVFVLGWDGRLYVAHTSPALLGVIWRDLSAPHGVTLVGSPSASAFATGVATGALGSDGNLWWRAGPMDNLGGWTSLGRPAATPIQGSPALAALPGDGAPLALALGRDGRLYESLWQDGSSDDPSQDPGWSPWTAVSLPAMGGDLAGPLTVITELPGPHDWIGTWADVPIDVLVRTISGDLWWLRRAGGDLSWTASRIVPSHPVTAVLGGVAVANPAASDATVLLHVYVADADGIAIGVMRRHPADGADTVAWTRLAPAPASPAAESRWSAIALGPDLSVLLRAVGQRVELAGRPTALSALGATPIAPMQPGPPGAVAPPGTAPTSAGAVPQADSFGDGFTGKRLDPRWLMVGEVTAGAVVGGGALALSPLASPNRTLLVQGALSGDLTLTARVLLPAGADATLRAGLILYLDDADWLTLGVTRAGDVSFCALTWGQAAPCPHFQLPRGADLTRGVLLRLVRQQATFSAMASLDGASWRAVGTWQPPAPAATATGATAPAGPASSDASTPLEVAPLAFTSAGFFAQDTAPGTRTADQRAWPRFAEFDLAAGADAAP